MPLKSAPICIVGAGVFGLSTAHHLVKQGYTNISVFECDNEIPSKFSAVLDLNKIVRAEYEDPFYTDLALVRFPYPILSPLNIHSISTLNDRPELNS